MVFKESSKSKKNFACGHVQWLRQREGTKRSTECCTISSNKWTDGIGRKEARDNDMLRITGKGILCWRIQRVWEYSVANCAIRQMGWCSNNSWLIDIEYKSTIDKIF
jgi:hypothetical protein